MIPFLMKIKIPRTGKQPISIYLPVFIAWVILIPLLILLLPIFLLVALITWINGYGRLGIIFFPMLISLLWNLQGLRIDVRDKDSEIYLSFI